MSTPEQDLQDILAPEDPPEKVVETQSDGTLRILNQKGAAWAMRVLARTQGEMADNSALAAEEREKIDAWEERVNHRLQTSVVRFTSSLVDFHQRTVRDEGVPWEKVRNKTIDLPDGVLSARRPSSHVEIVDEAEFLKWAKEHPARDELLKVTVAPSKSGIKKLLVPDAPEGKVVDQATGEVVPGVAIERGDVRFTVSTNRSE